MSFTAFLVRVAARRWPDELAADLEREWLAELAALPGRPWRRLAFAGSLAVSPAADGPTWRDRARGLAVPAAVTLLAAALCNGARLSGHYAGSLAETVALAAGLALMAYAGRRARPGGALPLGVFLFAFLLAGNPVAVMPFMGWRDVGPAVVVWTVVTALAMRSGSRLVAAAGAVAALDLAVAAGSVHAARSLGEPLSAALLWLPQSMLPGLGDSVLLGNAAAMAGVLTFGTAYVLSGRLFGTAAHGRPAIDRKAPWHSGTSATGSIGTPATGPAGAPPADPITAPATGSTGAPPGPAASRGNLAAGLAAAAGAVAVGAVLQQAPRAMDAAFGFGFLAHPAGLAAAALLVALVVLRPQAPAG